MNGDDHVKLVELAFAALRGNDRRHFIIEELRETCLYPDIYAVRIAEGKEGLWRKYFSPKEIRNTHPKIRPTLRDNLPAVSFYARNAFRAARRGDAVEAARFIGVFSHFIGDLSQPAHHFVGEKYDLLPPPPHLTNCELHVNTERPATTTTRPRGRPATLGLSVDELVFRIESRLINLQKSAVAAIVPLVQAFYAGRGERMNRHFDHIMAEAAELLADFCHTVARLAEGKIDTDDLRACGKCDLRAVAPMAYDVEGLWGGRPILDFITTKDALAARPFKMTVATKGEKWTAPVKGICAIPYAMPAKNRPLWSWIEYKLPKNVFSRFEALVGLDAELRPQASYDFEVVADGKVIGAARGAADGDAARKVSADISGARKLRLVVRTDGSTDKLAYPIWGEPKLVRKG